MIQRRGRQIDTVGIDLEHCRGEHDQAVHRVDCGVFGQRQAVGDPRRRRDQVALRRRRRGPDPVPPGGPADRPLPSGDRSGQVAGSVEATGERPQVSTRDAGDLRARLDAWLAGRPEVGARPSIDSFERPETNGMSSETLLFDASWEAPDDPGTRVTRRLVARLCPDTSAYPVFPTYDMAKQARVMQLVRDRTEAPVPVVRWNEPSADPLGAPFFVMERVEGRIPSDNPPYHASGWVTEIAPAERGALWNSGLDALAAIHPVDPASRGIDFLDAPAPDADSVEWQLALWKRYFDWAADGRPFELALVRAMIGAAKADGHIDAEEQRAIFAQVERIGLDAEAKAFVFDALAKPADGAQIAAAARTPEQAAELYLASRLAIDPDEPAERAWLEALAHRLSLPEGLAAHLDRQAEAAAVAAAPGPASRTG